MMTHFLLTSLLSATLSSAPLRQDAKETPQALYNRALAVLALPNPDFSQVASLFQQAADSGLPRAQRSLGELYRDGRGVSKDSSIAFDLFRKAAVAGDSRAQANLGDMYVEGIVVKKDHKQAVEWFRKSAAQKDPSGQLALGAMYINGWGVKKDAKEALKWYREAAEQGAVLAQFALASLYEFSDPQRAIEWYTKALQQGFEPARAPLEALRNPQVLTPQEAETIVLKKMVRVDPPLARAARIRQVFQFQIFVDIGGRVRSAKLISGNHALLNQAAYESVMTLQYNPLVVNGQPKPFTTTVVVNYDF